jgi:hypothetical protein
LKLIWFLILSSFFICRYYLFCPLGQFPFPVVALHEFCVNPLPWHEGCCPPGKLPPLLLQLVSVDPDTFANAAGITDAEDIKIANIAAIVIPVIASIVLQFVCFR